MTFEALVQELYDAAAEIAKDDQDFRQIDFEGFCRVMWHEDEHMKKHGFDRETYRLAMQSAWEKLPR